MTKKQKYNKEKRVKQKPVDDEIRFDHKLLSDSKFKRILMELDSFSSSPLEYLMTALLCCLSGAIGKLAYYQLTESLRIFLNLWGILIGKSTVMRKTSAINLVSDPLVRISDEMFSECNRNQENNESCYRECIILPADSTPEKLSIILEQAVRGLLIYSEFASFLRQLSRKYSGDEKQLLTNIYDVPRLYEITRISRPSVILRYPYLSIIGATTMDWLVENSSPVDFKNGFNARFIYSIRNKNDKPLIPLLNLADKKFEDQLLTDTYHNLLNQSEIKLTISKQAEEFFNKYEKDFYKEINRIEENSEISFKARLIINTLKFAGIIALVNSRTNILKKDMADAIHISAYYKKNIEKLLCEDMTVNSAVKLEEKILKIIKREGGRIRHSDLCNLANASAEQVRNAASSLQEKEKIVIESDIHPYNKKPTRYYSLKNNEVNSEAGKGK